MYYFIKMQYSQHQYLVQGAKIYHLTIFDAPWIFILLYIIGYLLDDFKNLK